MSPCRFPPASLAIQLAELKREKKMRAGVYEHWIANGKIKRQVAENQTNALDGAIATLERLVDAQARGEPGRAELIAGLRLALVLTVAPSSDTYEADIAKIKALLDRVPE